MNSSLDHAQLTNAMRQLPAQPISIDVLREKYLKEGESTVDELYDHVARA